VAAQNLQTLPKRARSPLVVGALHIWQSSPAASQFTFALANLVYATKAMWLCFWQNLLANLYALPSDKLVLQAVTVSRVAATGGAVVFLCAITQSQGGAYVAGLL